MKIPLGLELTISCGPQFAIRTYRQADVIILDEDKYLVFIFEPYGWILACGLAQAIREHRQQPRYILLARFVSCIEEADGAGVRNTLNIVGSCLDDQDVTDVPAGQVLQPCLPRLP